MNRATRIATGRTGIATILIVDDLWANRKFLVTLLRHHGHRLLEAADGGEGLASVRAERPDLVITDVLMPVMDGFEFVRQLRLDPGTSAIPVVFYTAHYGEREARALALSGGVADVLTKPADSADVMKVVGRLLSGESKTGVPRDALPLSTNFDRDHLRLLTDKLSGKAGDLRIANSRLRALINIGLEFASERDIGRRLDSVCAAARDLFGATYATVGILDRHDRTVQRVVSCGVDAANWIKTGDAVSGILATAVAERRTMRGDNASGDPAALHLPVHHPDVHAFLAAPITSPNHVYGWLCLVGNEGSSFTEDDEHLTMALLSQVGRIYELEHEILERKQAEAAVGSERDRAQQYLDTAGVILLALDLEGRITLVNRYACSVLGWTADELVGRDWIETCVPASARGALGKRFANLLRGDTAVIENPILTRAGGERLIEWRNSVLHDEAGHAVGTFSSGADITERNQALEAVQTAEERMRFALEAAGVGIWDMDCTTGKVKWSETLETHYGLKPGAFGGTFDAFIECIHPADRESALDTLRKAIKLGTDFSIQNRAIWPDGTLRWLTAVGRFRLGENGEALRGVGISLDVTERRTLEEQYQQAQKMEAIGRLAGGVAHDFNNLLTVILGYCDLLLDEGGSDELRVSGITEIQKAGLSAAGLTRQLLAFSRKAIIEPTLVDLNTVVTEMRPMLDRLIREDVKVVLGLRAELGRVKADRGQMEQIIVNLAVNARDAMPSGGTLTIETANVELDEHYAKTHSAVKPGPHVVLTVSDTGVGMTPEVQARVFEPFFTTKELGKGTGLGLATVHGIVTRGGGSVHTYSEVGRGTSFKVYFPRADASEPIAATTPAAGRSAGGGQTVLVVDDAEGLRELASKLLRWLGYTVLVAANAKEAVEQFKRHPSIDVLLTDVVMPGASGPELTRQLIEWQPALRVIYMSGYTEEAIVQRGVVNAGIAFLHKPFTAETLGQKVRDVLDR